MEIVEYVSCWRDCQGTIVRLSLSMSRLNETIRYLFVLCFLSQLDVTKTVVDCQLGGPTTTISCIYVF